MIHTLTIHLKNINPTAPILVTIKSQVPLSDILDIKAFDVTDTTRAVLPDASIPVNQPSNTHHCHDTNCSHTHTHTHEYQYETTNTPFIPASNDPHDTAIHSFVLENTNPHAYINIEKLKRWLTVILWNEPEQGTADTNRDTTASSSANTDATSTSTHATAATTQHTSTISSDTSRFDIYRMKGILNVRDAAGPTYIQCVQQMYDIQQGSSWPTKYQNGQPFTRLFMIGRILHEQKLQQDFQKLFE